VIEETFLMLPPQRQFSLKFHILMIILEVVLIYINILLKKINQTIIRKKKGLLLEWYVSYLFIHEAIIFKDNFKKINLYNIKN